MRRAAIGLALASLVGCAVTDTGNPPLSPPDRDRMHATSIFGGLVTITGEPGAVEVGRGVVRVTNLESSAAPEDLAIAGDGSFAGPVPGDVGDVLRMQVVDGESRSRPLDVIANTLELLVHPLACMEITPPLELDLGAIGAVTDHAVDVRNGCAETIEIAASTRRGAGEAALVIDLSTSASTLPPEASATLTVTVATRMEGEAEEVVFVEATASSADRFPLTVRAHR